MIELVYLGIFLFFVVSVLCYNYEPTEKQKAAAEITFRNTMNPYAEDPYWKKVRIEKEIIKRSKDIYKKIK